MGTVLTTDKLRDSEKFDFWHEVVCKTYAHCEGIANDPKGFAATTDLLDLGASQLSEVRSSGIRYQRRVEDVRRNPQDDVFIACMLDGEGFFEQSQQQHYQRSGDILVYDSGKPYVHEYPGDYRALLMRVPRELMRSRVANLDKLGGRLIRADTPFASLISSVLVNAGPIAAQSMESGVAPMISMPVLDLVTAAIVQASGESMSSSRHQDLLERVQDFMRTRLADDELSLETIAAAHHVSVRSLSRLFAEQGISVKQWLLAQRLDNAYRDLSQGRVRSVTEAALNAGFRDLSHFSRAFRKQFGCTPVSLL